MTNYFGLKRKQPGNYLCRLRLSTDLLPMGIFQPFDGVVVFTLRNNQFATLLTSVVSTIVSAWSWCLLLQEKTNATL